MAARAPAHDIDAAPDTDAAEALAAEIRHPAFIHDPHPDHPGWLRWELSDADRFNTALGPLIVRRDGDGRVRLRAFPARAQSNLSDNVHGGALLGMIDVALFATARLHGIVEAGVAVTLDLSTQFIAGAAIDRPLDLVSEVLRETGRLVFVRGLIEQQDAAGGTQICASYSGTIRKPARR
ncbi:PaaI family thioesterase [Sphingomonas changnyeongensis]|uniref:PaaI family thioesterase n=1 Tax=Sphingomonas changnyeongensis TaxID=2698679 RepID=A0A7Z2S557_9SPHN|nr:PaaI family thioesterase [Sphingomonas changnyeongensis]QHL90765.1 PaaI family thioesterase [Sphingomonas changnyeongensis]